MPRTKKQAKLEARFWKKVDKNGPIHPVCGQCWLWTAGKTKNSSNGYGRIGIGEEKKLAHRISYEIHYGEVPSELFVLHRCDTRTCVNPEHLFTGTNAQNMRDMVEKSRQAHLRGELNGMAKLFDADRIEIRRLYATGKYTQQKLADRYRVTQTQISKIVLRSK